MALRLAFGATFFQPEEICELADAVVLGQSWSSPALAGRARGVSLTSGGRLFRRRRSTCGRSRGRGGAANPSALVRGGMARRLAAARSAGALSPAVILVDRRPGATFGLLLRNATAFVALFDVLAPCVLASRCISTCRRVAWSFSLAPTRRTTENPRPDGKFREGFGLPLIDQPGAARRRRNMCGWRQLGRGNRSTRTVWRQSLGNIAMVQSTNDNLPLSGVRVLVVEDDPLMAMDLEDTLAEAGAIVAWPLPDPGRGDGADERR